MRKAILTQRALTTLEAPSWVRLLCTNAFSGDTLSTSMEISHHMNLEVVEHVGFVVRRLTFSACVASSV